jgi:hypothetical protein
LKNAGNEIKERKGERKGRRKLRNEGEKQWNS